MSVGYAFILTVVLMVSLWYFWFFEYKRFLLDKTRQRLFKIRAEFFHDAVAGKIEFNAPLYGMTRETLNGAIRFTHNITVWQIAGILLLAKNKDDSEHVKNYKVSWSKAFLDNDSDTAKKTVLKVHSKMHLVLFQHLVSGSLFLRVLVFILGLFLFLFKGKKLDKTITSNKTRDKWSVIDAEVNRSTVLVAH